MICKKPRDLLCGLGINTGSDCDSWICRFNSILQRHYSSLVGNDTTKGAIGFIGGGIQILNTQKGEDIYKVLGLYLKIDNCNSCKSNCLKEVTGCGSEGWYTMGISESLYKMDAGEYKVDGNKIDINVGEGVTEGYIVYARGPKQITSMDDDICLNPIELEMLQLSIMRFNEEVGKNFDMASYYDKSWFNAKNRLVDIESRIPQSIGFGIGK